MLVSKRRLRWTLVIWSSCVALAGVASASDAPSNLDLMTRLSGGVMEELVDNFRAEIATRGVKLKPHTNNETYQFLTNIVTSVLTAQGVKTYQPSNAQVEGEPPLVLEFQTLEFSIGYTDIYRSYLIGGKRVKRAADVTILSKLVDPADDSVVWIGEASRDHSDQFSWGELDEVEAGTFTFTKPERKGSGWGKIVEPVFVSGIIVGLIYLFFSNQDEE